MEKFSSEELVLEVIRRVKATVARYPSVLGASKAFNTEGHYVSPLGYLLSQQQLARYESCNYTNISAALLSLARAQDNMVKTNFAGAKS